MIVIIDGNQLACRCYFALNKPGNNTELTTSYGIRTELIYAFLNSFKLLVKTYKDNNNTIFFLTWDGGNAKRKSIFPAYKAGRKPFESAFYKQLDEIRKIVSFLGIKQYYFSDIEADDLIGTLTIKSRKLGKKVLIISSDHDFEQLISKHVTVLHPMGNNIVKDVDWVKNKYGIEPSKIIDIMSMTGDATDNIPGIESIGPKTAVNLILANGSLENIFMNIETLKTLNRKGDIVDVKEDLKVKIKENFDNIRLANKLCQLDCNLKIEPDFKKQPKDFASLETSFKEFEFQQFLENFMQWETEFSWI